MCVGFINWTSIYGPLTKLRHWEPGILCVSPRLFIEWHKHILRGLEGWLPNIYRDSAGPTVLRIWKYREHQGSQCPYLHRLTIYTEYIFTLGSVFTSSRLGPYPPSWVYCLRSPHLLSHGTYPESARVTTLNGNIFILFLYLHDSLVRYRIFIQILQVFSHFFSLSYFFGNFKYGNLSVLTHWI